MVNEIICFFKTILIIGFFFYEMNFWKSRLFTIKMFLSKGNDIIGSDLKSPLIVFIHCRKPFRIRRVVLVQRSIKKESMEHFMNRRRNGLVQSVNRGIRMKSIIHQSPGNGIQCWFPPYTRHSPCMYIEIIFKNVHKQQKISIFYVTIITVYM